MRAFLISLLLALSAGATAQTVTLPNGSYTAVVSPSGVTFTPVAAPVVWPPAPTVTPPCAGGGNQVGGTWQHGTYPAWVYVGGTCPPPPVSSWQPLKAVTNLPIMAKPAKGASWVTTYGKTEIRATAHATDIPGSERFRNDYSRREPWNADNTRFFGDQGSGYWGLYDATTWTYIGKLNGPAGDAEMQWDPVDPRIAYFLPNNGGTVLRRLDVNTNTSTVQYDFTADVKAIFGSTVARCWTKSEGSPSRDNRLWGLLCQTNSFGMLGYAVLDVNAKRVVWSKRDTAMPDHVSMSPSGRYFVRSGDDAQGTLAYALDGSNATRTLHHKSEHSDLGVLPNGHDVYVSVDYQTNEGDMFAIDMDTGSKFVFDHVYHNPLNPETYSVHFSMKAFGAPGWGIISRYGAPSGPANVSIVNVVTGAQYGLAVNNGPWVDYSDEPHGVANRTLSRVALNWGSPSKDIDVYVVNAGTLPQ